MAAHLTFLDPEPAGGYAIKSKALRQCGARPTVTFPAAERDRPLTGSRLHGVRGTTVCEQLVQRPSLDRESKPRPLDRKPNAPRHGMVSER